MNAIRQHLPTAARTLLGLVFLVFGLNYFLGFLPQPPVSAQGGAFLGALAGSGYVFPVIKTLEIAAGAMLIAGVLAPLALVLLAPITINVLAFHLVVEGAGLALPLALVGLQLYLAWTWRAAYAPLFRVRERAPRPVVAPVGAVRRAA